MLAARNRERTHRDRERFAVLAATGEIKQQLRDLPTTVARLNELLVPTIADVCIVDAVSAGEIGALAVLAAGPRGDEIALMFAARPPLLEDNTRLPEQPFLAERVAEPLLRRDRRRPARARRASATRRSAPRSSSRYVPAGAGSAR